MRLLDFLQLRIVKLFRKFHRNILKNEGAGENFLGFTMERSQNSQSIIAKKEHKMNILKISFVV